MKLDKMSRLLMLGDSITDAGRRYETWPGDVPGFLGTGYVALVDAFLSSSYPEHKLFVLNKGISGNTVRDLKKRWQVDVLEQKPDWLSIMIGTNDVWRQFDLAKLPDTHVLPDEYETTLEELVRLTCPRLKGLVLMTPFFVEPNRSEPMRQRMDEYGAIVRKVAERNGTLFVDTQAAFDAYLAKSHSATLAGDRVHPNPAGHMILARAFLRAIDFEA